MKEFTEITREMIEGCLDDDINEIHGSWMDVAARWEVESCKIFKTFLPNVYQEFFNDYCDNNHIIQKKDSKGVIHYYEESERI